jgi:hypothetical protein
MDAVQHSGSLIPDPSPQFRDTLYMPSTKQPATRVHVHMQIEAPDILVKE